jgi:SAM-dependent methyltransferase
MKRVKRSWQDFGLELLRRFKQAAADEHVLAEEYRRQTEFVMEVLSLSPGDRVLDLGCGMGEHCLALSEAGIEAVGIDVAPSLVEYAQKQASQADSNAQFICADMRQFRPDEPFDAVMTSSGTFAFYAADDENSAVVQTIRASLCDNGRFLVGPSNPSLLNQADFCRQEWHLMDDGCLLREIGWEQSSALLRERMVFLDERGVLNEFAGFDGDSDGQMSTCYDLGTLRMMIEGQGLQITGLYGSYDLPPAEYVMGKSPRLLIAGRR